MVVGCGNIDGVGAGAVLCEVADCAPATGADDCDVCDAAAFGCAELCGFGDCAAALTAASRAAVNINFEVRMTFSPKFLVTCILQKPILFLRMNASKSTPNSLRIYGAATSNFEAQPSVLTNLNMPTGTAHEPRLWNP